MMALSGPGFNSLQLHKLLIWDLGVTIWEFWELRLRIKIWYLSRVITLTKLPVLAPSR